MGKNRQFRYYQVSKHPFLDGLQLSRRRQGQLGNLDSEAVEHRVTRNALARRVEYRVRAPGTGSNAGTSTTAISSRPSISTVVVTKRPAGLGVDAAPAQVAAHRARGLDWGTR